MIVRKSSIDGNGIERVTHWLTIRTALPSGSSIRCQFDAGETIKPVKSSVGNVARGVGSELESTYGDGNVAYDPANPVGLSSGLDFRETDARGVLGWSFSRFAKRRFTLKVIGRDPRVQSSSETPALFLNFATSRMHHIQNAGIGGFRADSFLKPYGSLTSHFNVSAFNPDLILIESCTNDDWATNEYHAWTEHQWDKTTLFNIDSQLFLQDIQKVGETYHVKDSRLDIESITPFSMVLSSQADINNVVVGDFAVIGDYKGDNSQVTVRIITGVDIASRTVSWGRELKTSEVSYIQALSDLKVAQIRGVPKWAANVREVISRMQVNNPDAKLIIATGGVPNLRVRRLEGYREIARELARTEQHGFVDFYGHTCDWSQSQPADEQAYLSSAGSVLSDGSSEYGLYHKTGSPLGDVWTLRGWSVLVDGVERFNDNCYVYGGKKRGWDNPDMDMTMSNYVWTYDQFKVVFTEDTPPPPGGL